MMRDQAKREAREAAMRARMRRLAISEPTTSVSTAPAAPGPEQGYIGPEQLAKRWHVSPTSIRRWFRDEPGVLRWGNADSRPGKKRAHLSLRIPPHVVERVRRRMALD